MRGPIIPQPSAMMSIKEKEKGGVGVLGGFRDKDSMKESKRILEH